jgi:uncharacterized membrane protein
MNLRVALLNRWDEVRNSYWFLPSVMALGAAALAECTLFADRRMAGGSLGDAWWVYTGSAEGARAVLQTIGTSMLGVAGVVFSITTVTLTLAANKFGPRIFRNFMADTGNQVVLGTFTATFLFCLLVLRQVRGSDGDYDRFIPHLSMLAAVILAVFNLGVLIYFIHHVASSIQTGNVIAAVGRDLLSGIGDLYPEQIGDAPPGEGDGGLAAQVPPGLDAGAVLVRAVAGGYVRRVEADDLVRRAQERDLVIWVERHPGDFAAAGDVLLRAWPPDRVTDEVAGGLRSAVVLGDQRTPTQDVRFPLGQLTEIACLALSSGVNDLYTAVLCMDRLGEGLALLAGRSVPSPYRVDDAGRLRVVAAAPDLPALLGAAFDPIRQNAASQPLVLSRLLEALARVADRARRPEDRAAALAYAEGVRERATGADWARVEEAFERVLRAAMASAARHGESVASAAAGPRGAQAHGGGVRATPDRPGSTGGVAPERWSGSDRSPTP